LNKPAQDPAQQKSKTIEIHDECDSFSKTLRLNWAVLCGLLN
jgi:hypothetical protein